MAFRDATAARIEARVSFLRTEGSWSHAKCSSERVNARAAHIQAFVPANQARRTPGFGVQLPERGSHPTGAQSRAVRPAMKPGTVRAFASRRRAHTRTPGPESLSFGPVRPLFAPYKIFNN